LSMDFFSFSKGWKKRGVRHSITMCRIEGGWRREGMLQWCRENRRVVSKSIRTRASSLTTICI
jgi:hypothetical protein